MNFMFRIIFLYLCLSMNTSTSQTIVQKSCTQQKRYPTLVPQTYTAYHLTTYITVEYVFCFFFPTFRCPRKVENTKTVSSLRTRLIESTVTRTVSVCCPGYEEIPDREDYCSPVCDEECENGGICYNPNECICKPQYTGVTCGEDVDECASSGICQHNCTNYFGYHLCTCDNGFYLDTDGSRCNEYSLQINSFQATLKSADSVSLDWQLDSDPYIQDILGLIESISINQISDTSSLLHLPPDRRSALLFNLLPNVLYTYELFILTIHGDLITSRISVATPPDGIECPNYYSIHHNNPCREGSVCRDTIDNLNYTCECLPGYSEPDCENINECSGNPCQNGALCVDGIDEYTCICSSQRFTGENCEIQQSLCDLDEFPCNGHGTCISESADYTCDCDMGYTGLRCEEEIDFCSSSPCLNGGSCTNGADNAICECSTNYKGDFCELIINPCIGYSCNGAQCFVSQDRRPVCNCSDHLTGDRCDIVCNDDNRDLCVCDTDTQDGACRDYCLEDRDDFYSISWNRAIRGSTLNVPCSLISSTLSGLVSRSCLSTSRWSDVNITECAEIPVTVTTDVFSNCTTAYDVAYDILTDTKQLDSVYSDSIDIDALFMILNDLSVYSNQSDCSIDLDKVIIEILSGLLTNSFVSRLQIDNKAKFQISLKSIEETISQISPTENVTFSETGVDKFLLGGANIDYLRVQLPIVAPLHPREYEIVFVSREFTDVSISIPSQILRDEGVVPQLDVFIIHSSEVFNSVNTTIKNQRELISQIISVNIRNKNQDFEELQVPVQITFEIEENDFESISCVYLNTLGEWSTDGVKLNSVNNNKVSCDVYHLSMFAVTGQQKIAVTSIVETHVNETQQIDLSVINLITLISSVLITALITVFIFTMCVTRFYTDIKGIRNTLNTVCMINTSSAHLLITLLIGLTVVIQLIQLREPVVCFTSRAMVQYSYMVLINSMITELIIGLMFVKFADEDGNLRKVNLILSLSLIICWATPAIVTLSTTIPLYSSISVLQADNTLLCAFLSTDETFYIITTYFFIAFAMFTSLSLIAILYIRRTAIAKQKVNFLLKFMPRSIIILITQLLLFVMIIPAEFTLPKQVKSHIFYLHQLVAIILLLLLMCYLQRGTFKRCFKVKEESKEDVETTTTIPKETNEKRSTFTDNECRFQFSPYPFSSNYHTVISDVDLLSDAPISPGGMTNHTRSYSHSGILESGSMTDKHSVLNNSQLYQIYEPSVGQDRFIVPPDQLRPLYLNEEGNIRSLPRYLIPCPLPSESAAHNPSQTDARFYLQPNLPRQMVEQGSFQIRMTDTTKPRPPRYSNAMSCDLLDTPEVARRGIPILLVEKRRVTKYISNSLPSLNNLSTDY